MGLDMYLNGVKFHPSYGEHERELEDGFPVKETTLELGYWRKHPNLHGYIVNQYADGVDECQRISLDTEALTDIASAIRENRLPHTEGFFFGDSEWHKDEVEANAQIFERAAEWLDKMRKDDDVWPDVIYQASW